MNAMAHSNARLSELFKCNLSQSFTELEKVEFFDYVKDPLYTTEIKNLITSAYENQGELCQINEQIKREVLRSIFKEEHLKIASNHFKLWQRVAVAIILTVGLIIFIYHINFEREQVPLATRASAPAPGKNDATLTLSSGKQIKLSNVTDGELSNEAGTSIRKMANGRLNYSITHNDGRANYKLNTLSTAKGETYMLTLPDQTKVWLNAASSLTYVTSFADGRERHVLLSGEAYFEVTKDKTRPFVVKTRGQKVRVLGTYFNINAYVDEPSVKTTLVKGSIEVSNAILKRKLEPGQQSSVLGSIIKIEEIDPDLVMDWKNGEFVINESDFKTLMRKIARWYDVEIVYDPSFSSDIKPRGWISRKENIITVLKVIEATAEVHFNVDGRRIIVTK